MIFLAGAGSYHQQRNNLETAMTMQTSGKDDNRAAGMGLPAVRI